MRNLPIFPLAAAVLMLPLCGYSAPVEVIPAELRGAIQPQVAVAPSGKIHVTFGKGNAVYYVVSADGGRTFSKPVQVGELPKLALGMRRGPCITATDKIVAITAISHDEGDLHSWSSADGGATWKASANVNDTPKSAREACTQWLAMAKATPSLPGSTQREASPETLGG